MPAGSRVTWHSGRIHRARGHDAGRGSRTGHSRRDARTQLAAATAHLDAGDLKAGNAHLALADDACGRARLLIRGGRTRAALLSDGMPGDDGPHYDPTYPDYDWSATEDTARLGV